MSALQKTGASSNLEERLKLLEETIARLENRAVSIADREPGGGPQTEVTDTTDDNHPTQLTNKDTIPQVRRCNFMQFKNRFTNEDGRYAIDVLVSGALLEQEMHEEMQFRQRRSDNSAAITHSRSAKSKDSTLKHQNLANAEALEKAQSHDVWIQRVRLQSPAVLKILSKVQGESWSLRPRTYMRPFLTIISFQPEMRKELQGLESRWASQLDGIATSPMTTVTSPGHTDEEMDNVSAEAPLDDCPEALAAMRCYVKFVDEEIMPQYTQFENLKASDDPKIRFSDVHYLFRTGELVYRPYGSDTAGKGDPREWKRTGKRLWRSYGIRSRDTGYRVRPSDHRKYDVMQQEDGQDQAADEAFLIKAFYLEYTGEEFCTVTAQFSIQPFTGLRRIRSLPVYPLRFGPEDVVKYMADAIELGDKALEHINHGHVLYDGWTVTRTPKGEPVQDANAMELKNSEYVHSDAMVDFNEAFQACPHWKPKRTILRPEPVDQLVESDDFPILWWSGPDRAKLKAESSEVVPVRTGVSTWEQNKFVSTDPLLFKMSENLLKGKLTTTDYLRPEDKALVACRVFAYVFQDRKWAQLDVQHMSPLAGSRDTLDSLRIPDDAKNLIQRSVKGHLLQKADERRYGQGSGRGSQDFIRGKGAGLFILLHGMPGVGKTTTAEAIAQFYGKPLFKITCGDFGLTPEQIETNLSAVFRLADSWDCILLIDEVDTFFSQRTKGDGAVAKNALVSVFLRILDYYTGILFMTTNRVGALDEAFRSRIHYSVLYPLLSAQQALDIWKINLDRLRTIDAEHQHKAGRKPMEIDSDQIISFAERHLFHNGNREKATQWWNGRQIRNIFQVARSLAYADAAAEADRLRAIGSTKTPPPPRLKLKYFDMMDQVTVEFEDYLKEVYSGQTASDLAKETEHRADRWRRKPTRTASLHGDRDDGRDVRRTSARSPAGRGYDEEDRNTTLGLGLTADHLATGGSSDAGRSNTRRGTKFRSGARPRHLEPPPQPSQPAPPRYQGQQHKRRRQEQSVSPSRAEGGIDSFTPRPHQNVRTSGDPGNQPSQRQAILEDSPEYRVTSPKSGPSPEYRYTSRSDHPPLTSPMSRGHSREIPRIVKMETHDSFDPEAIEDEEDADPDLDQAAIAHLSGHNRAGSHSQTMGRHYQDETSRGVAHAATTRSVHVVKRYDIDEREDYYDEREGNEQGQGYLDGKNEYGKRQREGGWYGDYD
ncbi:hypothetical protein V8F06_014132 [Rhypophila decipiens]